MTNFIHIYIFSYLQTGMTCVLLGSKVTSHLHEHNVLREAKKENKFERSQFEKTRYLADTPDIKQVRTAAANETMSPSLFCEKEPGKHKNPGFSTMANKLSRSPKSKVQFHTSKIKIDSSIGKKYV